MGDQREAGIAWTDETWNPVRGCSRVSPGCEHCYAERMASRFTGPGQAYEGLARITKRGEPQWTGKVRMVMEHLTDPWHWKRPRRVFVNSMSDLFHDELSDHDIAIIFGIMAAAPAHTFQVLTKRPARMLAWFEWLAAHAREHCHESMSATLLRACNSGMFRRTQDAGGEPKILGPLPRRRDIEEAPWPLPNVWLGVTAEDQQRADERIPLLLQTPAAIRFVSVEPQLGPVDLNAYLGRPASPGFVWAECLCTEIDPSDRPCVVCERKGIDWVITGAESGHGARPYDLAWARSLRDQCVRSHASFFLKQTIVDGKKVSTPALDGVVHAEFPR